MKNEKNNKGITLMALVITIVILIILASIGTYSGIQVVKSAQFTAFSTELKIMQTQVNKLYEEKKNGNDDVDALGKTISSSSTTVQSHATNAFNASGITDTSNYKYFDTDTIKSLNIEGVEGEFFVNVDKRSVVSYDGFEYEGATYYTINQLPDSLYNVEYSNDANTNKPDFDFKVERLSEGQYRISARNINYAGNINNWNLEYKIEGEDEFKESRGISVKLYEEGTYKIKIKNGDFESEEKTIIVREPQVGDTFKYETILNKAENAVNSTKKAQLISDLGTYSGNTDSGQNTDSSVVRDSLTWKVLDVKDGKIRLISATSTISKIGLYNYNGYNNAVYLLDKACDTLYSIDGVGKAQNLKIEDIEEHLTYDYTQYANSNVDTGKYGGTKEYTSNLKYPNIYKNEVGCKLIDTENNIGNTVKLSEQASLIDGRSTATNILKTTQTYWNKEISKTDFKDLKDSYSKYYTLFINNGSNHSTYWLSSRCVDCGVQSADFNVYNVGGGKVKCTVMVNGGGVSIGSVYTFRPVVSLKSDVKLELNSSDEWIIE